jgi:hypothetical protein
MLTSIAHPAACRVQMLMQHGAQLDQVALQTSTCMEAVLLLQDECLLQAILSCTDKMTPKAKSHLAQCVDRLYNKHGGAQQWLALLSAKGLDMLEYMGNPVVQMPMATGWTQVGSCWGWSKGVQHLDRIMAC